MNMRKMMLRAGLAAMAIGIAGSASAGVTLFSNRAVFATATGANTIETFGKHTLVLLTGGVLNSSTTGTDLIPSCGLPNCDLKAGEILPGVTYSTSVVNNPGGAFTIQATSAFPPNGLLVSGDINDPIDRKLSIAFDTLQTSFGFESFAIMGSFSVQAFGDNNALLFTTNHARPARSAIPTFYGWQNDATLIRRLVIDGGGNEDGLNTHYNFQLDNFTFNGTPIIPTGGVPEPASWAMMIAGFGLVGSAMRRRTAQISYA